MTKTSQTSSLYTATLVGLFDELEKIAEEKKDPSFKKMLKNVGLFALGGAAGTGVSMLGHEALKMMFKERYERLLPATRMKMIAPLIGIGTAALTPLALVAYNKLKTAPEKHDD